MKKLIKSPGFWTAVAALIVIITQLCGVKIAGSYVNEIISGVCAILVVTGLISTKDKENIDESLNANENDDDETSDTDKT